MRRFEINSKGHLISFAFFWLLLLIGRLIFVARLGLDFSGYMVRVNFRLFAGLWAGYLIVNPDIDIVLQKVFGKMLHRWVVTHSVLLPIIIFWLLSGYIIPEFAEEFRFCLLVPVVVHLFADFKIVHLMDKNKDGMWRYSTYPIKIKGSYRLSKNTSYILMVINAIAVLVYSLFIFGDRTVFPNV